MQKRNPEKEEEGNVWRRIFFFSRRRKRRKMSGKGNRGKYHGKGKVFAEGSTALEVLADVKS